MNVRRSTYTKRAEAAKASMMFREGHVLSDEDKEERQEWYEACFPCSSNLLTSDEAVKLLKRLTGC